jgi:hypothetical protein
MDEHRYLANEIIVGHHGNVHPGVCRHRVGELHRDLDRHSVGSFTPFSVIGHPFASRLRYFSYWVSQAASECVIHFSEVTKPLMNGCSLV